MINKIIIFFLVLINFVFANHLTSNEAFQIRLQNPSNNSLILKFKIAKGYGIYKDKIHININKESHSKIKSIVFPKAVLKYNEFLGNYYIYNNDFDVFINFEKFDNSLQLEVTYQGCKGLDFCYPEISKIISLKNSTNNLDLINNTSWIETISNITEIKNVEEIANYFNQNIFLIVTVFFIFGILLSFTPCTFPLLSILFAIIAKSGNNFKRSILLAISYILGMASAYSLMGFFASNAGMASATILQNHIINYITAFLLILMSLSSFEIFEIKIPDKFYNHLVHKINFNNIFASYISGTIASIILSSCITAPLAGALLYISSTKNVLVGTIALFSLGIGRGIPLLIIALIGKKAILKDTTYTMVAKEFLGFIVLWIAIYMLTKNHTNLLFFISAFLLLFMSCYFLISKKYETIRSKLLFKILALLILITSLYIFYKTPKYNAFNKNKVYNANISSIKELNNELNHAKSLSQPVILDFYASWCISCLEFHKLTIQNPQISNKLNHFFFIRVDITKNDKYSKELLKKYNVIAPPTLIFIDRNGNIIRDKTIIGYTNTNDFMKILNNLEGGI